MIAASRQVIRATMRRIGKTLTRSGIEAGGAGWRWSGVSTLPAPQQSTLAARGAAKNRAAAASQNNPIAARVIETLTAALVGKGWQALSQNPDQAIAREWNDDFEALIWPHMAVMARALVRDGECFVRLIMDPDGLRLVILPADQIDPSLTRDLGNGARIVAGIELDATDRPVAYHVTLDAPGSPFALYSTPLRIPPIHRHTLDQEHQLCPKIT